MSIRITLVFICTCIYAYYHNIEIYDTETLDYTEKYVVARADRESGYFMMAESNVKLIQNEFLRKIDLLPEKLAKERFDEMMGQDKDTVWRAQGKYSDFKNLATVAILPSANFNDLFYKSVITAFDVASQFGPALRDRYFNTYISMFVNDVTVLYEPNSDYSRLNGIKELSFDYECETYSSPKLNPGRKVFFTNIYADLSINKEMLSVGIPIDYKGQWIGGVGHDLLIDDVIKRSDDDTLPGSYNIIFSKKGELIAFKNLKAEIQKSGGQLRLDKITDPKILSIWNSISKLNPDGASIKSKETSSYLTVKRIYGPDWLFVNVLPAPLVMEKAKSSILLVVLVTLIALIVELVIIHRILKKDIAEPLSDLIYATQNIYEEPLIDRIPTSRNDELGTLASSFKNMAIKVSENKKDLEIKVQERTNALLNTNNLLIKKNETLDRLNKQKNEFIAIASHDLKNPLAMIMLSINMIKKKMEPQVNEKVLEKLDIIQSQSKRMMDIIGDYLNYTLIDESNERPDKVIFDFTEYINYILNQNEIAIINKSLIMTKKLEMGVMINSNKNICGNIIENLLSNAIKFTESGRKIFIELYQNEKSIFLQISDEGLGIPKEEHHLVFRKFAKLSTKPTEGEGSTGLGLAIVKQLVDKIGAKITFESNQHKGTKFLVEFPKSDLKQLD